MPNPTDAAVAQRPEFTVDEALRIADQNADTYDKVASVSRTLAAEVRRLRARAPAAGEELSDHQICQARRVFIRYIHAVQQPIHIPADSHIECALRIAFKAAMTGGLAGGGG